MRSVLQQYYDIIWPLGLQQLSHSFHNGLSLSSFGWQLSGYFSVQLVVVTFQSISSDYSRRLYSCNAGSCCTWIFSKILLISSFRQHWMTCLGVSNRRTIAIQSPSFPLHRFIKLLNTELQYVTISTYCFIGIWCIRCMGLWSPSWKQSVPAPPFRGSPLAGNKSLPTYVY